MVVVVLGPERVRLDAMIEGEEEEEEEEELVMERRGVEGTLVEEMVKERLDRVTDMASVDSAEREVSGS